MDSKEVAALISQDKIDDAVMFGFPMCGAMVLGPTVVRDGRKFQLVYMLAVSGPYPDETRPYWQALPEETWDH